MKNQSIKSNRKFKLRWFIPNDSDGSVDEYEKADNGRQDEPGGVEAEPGEIECELFAEILSHDVNGLKDKPVLGSSPIVPQVLSSCGHAGIVFSVWLNEQKLNRFEISSNHGSTKV